MLRMGQFSPYGSEAPQRLNKIEGFLFLSLLFSSDPLLTCSLFSWQHGPPTLQRTCWNQFALLKNLSQPVVNQMKDRMQMQTFKAGDLILTKGTIGTSMVRTNLSHGKHGA
eukprot:1677688-Rhodomonas_salina.2